MVAAAVSHADVISKISASCDWSVPQCIPFLRKLDKDLQKFHPALHQYIHKLYVPHASSGKKGIEHREIIQLIEGPAATPQGLATPRRATSSPASTPGTRGPYAPLSDD